MRSNEDPTQPKKKKEGNSSVCYNMEELKDIMLSEISQSQKRQTPYDSTYMRYFLE